MGLREILDRVAAGTLSPADAEGEVRRVIAEGPAGANVRSPAKRGFVVLLGLILAVIGCVLLAVAWSRASGTMKFAESAERAEGKVVRVVGGKSKKPVVRYEVKGVPFEITGEVGTSPPAYRVGDTVPVLYVPDRPGEGVIDSILERWFITIISGGLGGVFTAIGLGILVARYWGKKPPPPSPEILDPYAPT